MSRPFEDLVRLTEAHLQGLRETDPRALELAEADLTPGFRRNRTDAPRAATPVPASASPPLRNPDAGRLLCQIAARISECVKCPLHRARTQTVPGQGHPNPDILFVGEGPGLEEDEKGLAFIGRSGELLTRLIRRMGLTRDEVFIGNIVKCRPTVDGEGMKDRPPTPEEAASCLPYLREQIAALQPRVIVTLGNVPLQALTGKHGITRMRGQWLSFESIPLMPTYHPSYLLRSGGEEKRRWWEVWDDMRAVLQSLSRPIPGSAAKRPAPPAPS